MKLHLAGVEALTLELTGALPADAARALAGPRIALEERGGFAPISLLLFQMRGLRPVGIPGPPFDYDEALWRIGVVHQGEPAWLAVACDLDSILIRLAGRFLVRYPVRAAAFTATRRGELWRARVDAAGAALAVDAVEAPASPAPVASRRVLVRHGDARYEIPWREDPAPHRREAAVVVRIDSLGEATFGARVLWDGRGLVHSGRVHHCSIARRLA